MRKSLTVNVFFSNMPHNTHKRKLESTRTVLKQHKHFTKSSDAIRAIQCYSSTNSLKPEQRSINISNNSSCVLQPYR